MKKIGILCFCFCILCGCGKSIGSFEQGTLDMKKLIQEINETTTKGRWGLSLLKEDSESNDVLETYGLAADDVISYGIYSSIIKVNPEEIIIFEVSDQQKELVKEKVRAHIKDRKENENYLSQYRDVLNNYKETEIGNYYIVVIGKDAEQVLQFITECA